jgi:hypothetical protein
MVCQWGESCIFIEIILNGKRHDQALRAFVEKPLLWSFRLQPVQMAVEEGG